MKNSRSSLLKFTAGAFALFVLAALGPAPIRGDMYNIKPHTNLQKQDEKTLEAEQNPVIKGQVGAPVAPHHEVQMAEQPGAQDAQSVLAAADRSGKGTSSSSASQVLAAAGQRMNEDNSSHGWLWALLVIGGVLAGVFGVKRWADNNIPNTPTITPQKRDSW